MKKLQNNFTTHEQSKRLLELGLPASSADCFYGAIGFGNGYDKLPNICGGAKFLGTIDMPCWSVGRLIEIIDLISSCSLTPQFCENYTESLVAELESMVCNNKFDISKLED